ncbi:putative quinol monooxygenase [Salinarimonas sp.]|uniref:putative quinol monooxygenase n=1 Tax=Salinarimonas sp. TaxID=2766526 RepID=UPI00391BD216
MFVIVVDFEIARESADAFMALIRENAEASLRDEPGCLQFDVCVDESDAASVFLYEVYEDEAAFEAHVASPHYARFAAASGEHVIDKRVRRLLRRVPA